LVQTIEYLFFVKENITGGYPDPFDLVIAAHLHTPGISLQKYRMILI